MSPHVILLGTLAVVLIVFLETRYELARDFQTANWIEFRHCVMFHPSICPVSKKAMERLYNNTRPSIWKLLFCMKPLSRKQYFSPGHIEIFFSKYDDEQPDIKKNADYIILDETERYFPIKRKQV